MELESHVEAFEYAVRKNAAARGLMAKGKLRDALDALNQAVAAAPSYHHSYANRAEVFQRMGLLPQSEADRKRASELAAAAGHDEQEMAEPPFGPPTWNGAPAHTRPRRSLPTIAFPTSLLIPGVLFVLLLAVTLGAMIGAIAILRGGDNEATQAPPRAAQTPIGSASQTASPSPSPVSPAAAAGSPFSFSTLEATWRARGIAARLGSPSSAFSGFKVAPVDASLTGGGSAQTSIFFYNSREAPQQDWDLVPGTRPAAKPGRTLPPLVSIWWNTNVIVVVRSASGDITNVALDAFLNLSP